MRSFYPYWTSDLLRFLSRRLIHRGVFAFWQSHPWDVVPRPAWLTSDNRGSAGHQHRQRRVTIMSASPAAGLGGGVCMRRSNSPQLPHVGMDFLVLSLGPLSAAWGRCPGRSGGVMLGCPESFASMNEVKNSCRALTRSSLRFANLIFADTPPCLMPQRRDGGITMHHSQKRLLLLWWWHS